MQTYKVVAATGNVSETSVEVLGEAYRKTFATRAEAEAVRAQLRDDAPGYGFGDVTYSVVEVDARRYLARISDGSSSDGGGSTVIDADSTADAWAQATAWAQDGDYGDGTDRVVVTVTLTYPTLATHERRVVVRQGGAA